MKLCIPAAVVVAFDGAGEEDLVAGGFEPVSACCCGSSSPRLDHQTAISTATTTAASSSAGSSSPGRRRGRAGGAPGGSIGGGTGGTAIGTVGSAGGTGRVAVAGAGSGAVGPAVSTSHTWTIDHRSSGACVIVASSTGASQPAAGPRRGGSSCTIR